MNDMTVGMENLPNIFIRKIILKTREVGYSIDIQLGMYDHRNNPSWKGKINDLKVKTYLSFDDSEMQLLNNGKSSLFDFQDTTTGVFVVSPQDFTSLNIEGDYDLYIGTVHYGIPELPNNLNIYAACFIDGFNFNISRFDKFYGPMAAENIFVNSQVNQTSQYFYYPTTNKEYGGPVHQKPDGSYMEGSLHTDDPHQEVVLVREINTKIQFFDMSDIVFAGTNTGNVQILEDILTPVQQPTGVTTVQLPTGATTVQQPTGATTVQQPTGVITVGPGIY